MNGVQRMFQRFANDGIPVIDIQNVSDYCNKHYDGNEFTEMFKDNIKILHKDKYMCFKTNNDTMMIFVSMSDDINYKFQIFKLETETCLFLCEYNICSRDISDIDKWQFKSKITEIDDDYEVKMYMQGLLFECLFAIQLMHCKNISLEEKDPLSELPSKARRQFLKRNKEPLREYYTLNIDPMKKILKDKGNIEFNGFKKALHICRGHFKTYEGKGLFGKYQGTFWIPQHLKGNKSEGEIVKDYKIIV